MTRAARLACALLLAGMAGEAAALRCNGRLVEPGDHAVQVRARCGEPYWIDAFSELLVLGEDGPLEQRIERPVEAWYFNFGPNRLLRRLLLIDDRLVREESLGYGVSRIGRDCRVDALPAGTPAGVVYARCGEPVSRRDRYAEVVRRDGRGVARRRVLRHEDWIYDIGANRDLRLLRIIDGRLQDIERLDR